nr:MAG: major capsid protein [Microvirus sp.]
MKMSRSVTLGGDRLGAGKKNRVELHGFERSTHDLGYVWRNTQAPGTLVPFMSMIALPGDTFDINLGADVKTHPTIGPLFASFKLQLDVFQCPIRLYNSWLHNNKLKINMSDIKLPYLNIECNPISFNKLYDIDGIYIGENTDDLNYLPIDIQQINPSSLLHYLGISGIGARSMTGTYKPTRQFNAVPYLAYFDIYKNYYANKQEEIGMMIHTDLEERDPLDYVFSLVPTVGPSYSGNGQNMYHTANAGTEYALTLDIDENIDVTVTKVLINYTYTLGNTDAFKIKTIEIPMTYTGTTLGKKNYQGQSDLLIMGDNYIIIGIDINDSPTLTEIQNQIKLQSFDLSNIDLMREAILKNDGNIPFNVPEGISVDFPYYAPIKTATGTKFFGNICSFFSQEGLCLKTYQSDIFNNWISSEWIDGENGVNTITAIDTSGGSFNIDTLNLSKKVYDMLNRIAISGGTYKDWLEAVYDIDMYQQAETPMYMGGLIKEIIFQEVISTAPTEAEPLGTLAGKGGMASKHKGGSVTIKVNEPSYIIGIVSITPRIDYYQGNQFDMNFKTVDDLHKPSLDEIGFQDLLTDKMAFWDTIIGDEGQPIFRSAGKQPAWLDYMTNYNRLHGNFADERNEMFMTLARRYQSSEYDVYSIKDLTTYIDPSKFNYAFAQTDLTAMNFWVQIGCDITARRKMSAKVMPNL